MAKCPVHKNGQERNPSLSIENGNKGVLLKCFAGCEVAAICAAIGIVEAELFYNHGNGNGHQQRKIVAEYDYHDEFGGLLFQVVRFEPKDFRQRKPDANAIDGWVWNLKGVDRVPFRLPQVIKAVKEQRTVYVAEGEKDVLALERAGVTATCNAGGAGKWEDNYGQYFQSAEVVIIADKDEPGRKHAQDVALKLSGIVKIARVIELPDFNGRKVKDAYDFLSAGATDSDLNGLWKLPDYPLLATAERASARYVDIYQNRGKLGVPFGIDKLDEISGGMKPGHTIVLCGRTGGGKSTMALHMIQSSLARGYGVLLFSLEMDKDELFDLIMSNKCSVDRNKFNTGFFATADFEMMRQGLDQVKHLPLFVEDQAVTSADQIRSRTLQLLAAKRIDLLVVDYIQFVCPEATKESREQQVAAISHKLRALARETKLPTVILSQLNDEGKLRESRVIAHNANVVLLIEQDKDEFIVSVTKGRGIPEGKFRLEFNRRFARLIPEPVESVQERMAV
jgi:KaiC/GvpD/RAD55 family RecA-like ATPase/5S rRNA maturation endonuclease (ribonuclease M5)